MVKKADDTEATETEETESSEETEEAEESEEDGWERLGGLVRGVVKEELS